MQFTAYAKFGYLAHFYTTKY